MTKIDRLTPRERVEYGIARALSRLPGGVQRRLAGGRPAMAGGAPLLPDIQLLLAALRWKSAPALMSLAPVQARRRMRRDCIVNAGPPAPVPTVRELIVDGADRPLRARHYAPMYGDGRRAPLLVFFHGGGFVLGDLDSHDAPCRLLCHEARAHVLSVEYRLAPEHKFPAAIDDALAAFAWAHAHAASLGADPVRVGVAGDSAGAFLSTVVAQTTARAGLPAPVLQLLLYPVVDRTRSYPSVAAFADGFLLTRGDMDKFTEHWLDGTGAEPSDPRVSPLCAPDLSGLAPALVVTAAFDPLRDEGEAYAGALHAAGVPTVLRRFDGLIHGFANLIGVSPGSRSALVAVARQARSLL